MENFHIDLITVPGIAGACAVIATAVLTRVTTLPSKARPWVVWGLAAVAVALGLWATKSPDSWRVVAAQVAAAFGVAQVAYVAFKPALKLLNGDRALTPPALVEVGEVPAAYAGLVVAPTVPGTAAGAIGGELADHMRIQDSTSPVQGGGQ